MPEIALFQPTALRAVVEKFMVPEKLIMLSRINKTPWPFPNAQWDVIRGSRAIANPNVPNSEAHIVPRLGRSQESARFVYLREKKTFEPTTLFWVREPGQLAQINAEKAVMREIADLNVRFDNRAEWMIWQMLKGRMVLDFPDVQADIDYKLPTSHKPAPAASWATATPQQIVNDVRAWKRIVRRDGRVEAQEAFTTEVTVQKIFDSFATNTAGVGSLLSDRMRDSYYTTGTLPGFMGLDWNLTESVYDPSGAAYSDTPTDPGAETQFVADNALYLGNYTENNPIELIQGPTADHGAPRGFTGKFSKTWLEEDPSDRQYLMEWNLLPVCTRPEQMIFVDDVTSTVAGDG